MMPYGFYSIGSRNGEEINLMVANWIIQVSFEPRLLAFALQKTSHTHNLVSSGKVLVVNLFRTEDAEAIKPYTKSTAKKPEKVAKAVYTIAPITGCPVPDGAAAYLECQVRQMIDIGGDHDLVIAEPVHAEVMKASEASEILSLPDLGWSYAG
jgi:flavin reductase (DIM6/NTAB) family NADH-FMN oxidoreductase RutF